MERKIQHTIAGYNTEDGAGVSLVRVLGHTTTEEYDPLLLLDSFDSTDPDKYIKGFPMHPHRGIETISYVYKGKMTHKDSLGNEDTITDGEVQWMTAGSGILHEEKLPPSERLLGVQLWLNLPAKNKMCPPAYYSIKNKDIKEVPLENGYIRLLAGSYNEYHGFKGKYQPLDYYDIHLGANSTVTLNTKEDSSLTIFTLIGQVYVGGDLVKEKTAVKLSQGITVTLTSSIEPCQILWINSETLAEPISWGGPIVMNTKQELNKAFEELHNGTFLQDKIKY